MNGSRFFELDPYVNLRASMISFRYKKIVAGAFLPVYLVLEANSLTFFLHSHQSGAHIELLQFHFSDHSEDAGKLTRQLSETWKSDPYDTKKLKTSSSSPFKFIRLPGEKYLKKPIFNQTELQHSDAKICFRTLFLHFLFDLQHSDLFQHSPHYDRLRTVIRENTLWNAILSKVEYVYQRELYTSEGGTPSTITRDYYRETEKKWLQLLIGEESGPVISGSDWFADNLEEEVNEVLWPGEDRSSWNGKIAYRQKRLKSWWRGIFKNEAPKAVPPTKKDKELFGNIANWYLNRYNYREAISLLDDFHPINRILISLPSMGALVLLLSGLAWVLGNHIFAVAFPLGLVALVVGSLLTKDRPITYLIERVSFLNVANHFSPRLIITLILAWFAYIKFGEDLSIERRLVIFYYFISVSIIPVYLYRTILADAPDLPFPAAFQRVFRVWFKVFWATLLLGGFVLTLSIWDMDPLKKEYSIPLFNRFYLYPLLLFKTAPIVFFTGLFVNLLFKDKRVTGF